MPVPTAVAGEEIPGRLETLRRVFTAPQTFKPTKTREQMTGELAETFADLADQLLSRMPPAPETLWQGAGDPVAHFLMKVMFCLFAEDVGLLPDKLFTKLIDRCLFEPEAFKPACAELFEKMKRGGYYGNDRVPHFNGGLFDDAPPLPLTAPELNVLARAAEKGWAAVEPSIFGTLFERILDPNKRAQIGAHYTSKADILLVVEPVVMTPLRRKWAAVQEHVAADLAKVIAEPDPKKRDVLSAPVRAALTHFRGDLGHVRILDPACGSGNFLYVALQQILDLDNEVVRFAARHDIALSPFPFVRPAQLHGIEINPYAAELAQNVIWIGYLQWLAEHNIDNPRTETPSSTAPSPTSRRPRSGRKLTSSSGIRHSSERRCCVVVSATITSGRSSRRIKIVSPASAICAATGSSSRVSLLKRTGKFAQVCLPLKGSAAARIGACSNVSKVLAISFWLGRTPSGSWMVPQSTSPSSRSMQAMR